MSRKQYLIAYDVSDDKRRTRIFKTLEGQGDHVQYSVFLCTLNAVELAALKSRLAEHVHWREDQVVIVYLGPAESDSSDLLVQCLGKPYNPSVRVQII